MTLKGVQGAHGIRSRTDLRGDEVVEPRSGEVVIGQPRRGNVHAGIGVGVGRNGGGVRTVRRKVDKERTASARSPRHVVPLDPLRRLVRNRVGGVVGLVCRNDGKRNVARGVSGPWRWHAQIE